MAGRMEAVVAQHAHVADLDEGGDGGNGRWLLSSVVGIDGHIETGRCDVARVCK